jgi:hypothetical protein
MEQSWNGDKQGKTEELAEHQCHFVHHIDKKLRVMNENVLFHVGNVSR